MDKLENIRHQGMISISATRIGLRTRRWNVDGIANDHIKVCPIAVILVL